MTVRTGIILIAFLVGAAFASAEKMGVALNCQTEDGDGTGMRLCTALRDQIAASPRYETWASKKQVHWGLGIISTTTDNTKMLSAQAVVVLVVMADDLEVYLNHYVLITGRGGVNHQAETIMAILDREIDKLQKARPAQ